MIWKIVFLLGFFNVLVRAPRTDTNFPEEENLEELYSKEFVKSLNSVRTSYTTDVSFKENDITLLSNECYPDENCLNKKKASVKKYHRKMQSIQCIHGLFVLKVLNELKAIILSRELTDLLRESVLKHHFYLTSMLSLLNMANWDAYSWQIEIFTFVAGLVALDANFRNYKEHFTIHQDRLQDDVLMFVSQCVQYNYLLDLGDITSELIDSVYSQMESVYESGVLRSYRLIEHYTVPNLMLQHLYSHQDFIFDWSMFGLELETSNVKRQLLEYSELYGPQQSHHIWELDPIGGNKYNALIANCILLRLVYFTWVHLHIYHTLQSRLIDPNVRQFVEKTPLFQMWESLVFPLKRALRMFRFTKNIYWSAIRIMTVNFENISKEELEEREEFTRNDFCRAVEDLGLASATDINQQLTELEVSENQELIHDIKSNTERLEHYTSIISYALKPVDGSFISIIVSAEGNETFVKH